MLSPLTTNGIEKFAVAKQSVLYIVLLHDVDISNVQCSSSSSLINNLDEYVIT